MCERERDRQRERERERERETKRDRAWAHVSIDCMFVCNALRNQMQVWARFELEKCRAWG